MASERYKYTPLAWNRQIRLLRLHPVSGPDESELSVDLIPVFLDAAPSFEALSYAWGDPLPTYEIHCSGRRAEIGASLFSALYHLRRHQALGGRRKWIWADALCINQDDTAERESQVRMMGDIYATASITVIWLGDADDHVTRAFYWLRRFSNVWEPLMESLEISYFMSTRQFMELEARFTENDAEAYDILRAAFDDEMGRAKAFEDIWFLLRRPWFMRKWVIQEVVKSLDHEIVLVSGGEWTHWVHLKSWFEFLEVNGRWRSIFVSSCPWGVDFVAHDDTNTHSAFRRGAILTRSIPHQAVPLARLLATTAMFKCTDPRDHIVSLLGIAENSAMFKDLIDYNTSTDDLYYRLTCAHLTSSLTLRILWSTHTIVPVDRRRTSSWIPNMEEMASRSAVSDFFNLNTLSQMGNACQSTEIQATVSGNSLLIKGRIIDMIEQLGPDMTAFPELQYPGHWSFTTENKRIRGIWLNWLNECQRMAESAGQDDRGLIDGMLLGVVGLPADAVAAAKQNFLACQQIEETLANAPDEMTWLKTIESMDSDVRRSMIIIESYRPHMLFRRFGRTRYGRIGWMPLVAEEGDHICVFDGMEFPYAVRQRQCFKGSYALVGDCLISSLMNGEAMELPGVESVIITLE